MVKVRYSEGVAIHTDPDARVTAVRQYAKH